jgi:alpha-tubulin suppressor-like RCC1 family protein
VPGAIEVDERGVTLTFVPNQPLSPNTEYELVVGDGVRDVDGEQLDEPYSTTFTTGTSSVGPPASLDVSPDTVYITAGTTYQLSASVRDANGNIIVGQTFTWASNDAQGLAVSPSGLVTGITPGLYNVSARVGNLTGFARVNVRTGAPASIVLSHEQASVGASRDTIILSATVRDARGRLIKYPAVTWTSSASSIATVATYQAQNIDAAFATVTGQALGTAVITASSGTAWAASNVSVVESAPVASVTVDPPAVSVILGFTTQLSATVRDQSGRVLPGRQVTWQSANGAIASVNAGGLVSALGSGTVDVTATSEGVSGTSHITGVALTFQSISLGGWFYTCGLSDGVALCWGNNTYGQLGIGSFSGQSRPAQVSGGLTFATLVSGYQRVCGITPTGAAYCWGENYSGGVGNGSVTALPGFSGVSVPAAVAGGLTFAAIATGDEHTCGLASGEAYCWGGNWHGQLGTGSMVGPESCDLQPTLPCSRVPVPVAGGHAFTTLSSGARHTCGLTTDGTAYCWGGNQAGQLGDSSTIGKPQPVPVYGGHVFVQIAVGSHHTCALKSDGAAFCWGANDGELGDGTNANSPIPVPVSGGLAFKSISAGLGSTCGVTTDGRAFCWGYNRYGQLGDGTYNDRLTPTRVVGNLTFDVVDTDGFHACGITTGRTTYCWGTNLDGELGRGNYVDSNIPVKVLGQP